MAGDSEMCIKITVVGDPCCGKKCLLGVIKTGSFADDYIPAEVNRFHTEFKYNDKPIELAITNATAQEVDRFHSTYLLLRPFIYPQSDVVLICFSVDSPESLENVDKKWASEAKQYCPNAQIIVVATKKDLRHDQTVIKKLSSKGQQPVSEKQGKSIAKEIGAFRYVECSAKIKDGVRKVLECATTAALQTKAKTQRTEKCLLI